MSSVTRLVLWRHGRTEWNQAGRFQGQTDIPLSDTGLSQAEATAPHVAAFKPDAIVSSPLRRALQTADALAEVTGLAVSTEDRLLEINVGTWAGLTLAEVRKKDSQLDVWSKTKDYRFSTTGETNTEVGQRVAPALRDIAAAHPGQTIVIVSHGTALRMGAARLCGLDYQGAQDLGALQNCAWSVLEPDKGRWHIIEWNLSANRGDGNICLVP